MRLIDADSLNQMFTLNNKALERTLHTMIDGHPTIPAEIVVHCGECKHSDNCICVVCEDGETVVCLKEHKHVLKNHFCGYGERKDGEK